MSVECLVSIIVPVYNVEKYLHDSIKSLKNQTYENLEIILVNDASSDKSLDICKEYVATDKRIILIEHSINRGLSVTRNDALDVARGEYICFVDSDDSLCENAIEILVKEAKKRNAEVLGFNANVISSSGITQYIKHSYTTEVLTGEDYLARMLRIGRLNEAVWLYFYKASFIINNNIRFLVGRVFEDEVWTPQVLLSAKTASYVDVAAYNYYIRESSIMTRRDINYKKYNDAFNNCKDLIQLAHICKNAHNGHLLSDYAVRIYMESTKYLIKSDEYDPSKIDYKFMKDNIRCKSTYVKYLIYRLGKKLYFKLKGIDIY